jgi:flagellar biosynthesis protein FlhB
MSQQNERGASRSESTEDRPPKETRGSGAWMASTAAQTIVMLVGLVVVLFAVGQAVGADLLGMVGDALATHTGQWLAVAVLALILVIAALRALSFTRVR